MKSNNKIKNSISGKVIINLIALMLVSIMAVGMVNSYSKVNELANKKEHNYFESYDMSRILSQSSYALYYNDKKNNSTTSISAYDALIEKNKSYTTGYDIDNFNYEVSRWDDNLKRNLVNLDFIAINSKNKVIDSNIQEDIKILENGDVDIDSLKTDKYQFYAVINCDANGKVKVEKVIGGDKSLIGKRLMDMQGNSYYNNQLKLSPITNMTYIYGIPKELSSLDTIYWGIKDTANYGHYGVLAWFILGTVIFTMIFALLIPYKRAREIVSFKVISKIPFEVLVFIIGCLITIVLFFVTCELAEFIRTGESVISQNINISTENIWVLNFLFWFIVFGVVFNIGLAIKHIFKSGVKKYFKEKSLIVLGIIFVVKLIKRFFLSIKEAFNNLSKIDLSEKNNKAILKIVGINALIMSALCVTWFFGIIGVAIYSATLFGIIGVAIYSATLFLWIRKKLDQISSKYNKLKEVTNKIAEGNLDVKVEEDLGLFEPFKKDLEKIQGGFKKAVQEEIKSEKMKTELISNVSHDLKTPLTSIITYVDLLKDKNLEEEKREQYLETLDRKSQRLQYLIEDLFEMSKASSGNINLKIEDVDVVSLMKQTLLELEYKINESHLNIKKNFPKGKVILQLDGQRTFRVFENLVINITKYAMRGTRVFIDIIENDNKVEIILKNMAAEEITFNENTIAERFVRGDESRNTEGSGLGLAIAKSFVELQGGIFDINIDGDLFKVNIIFNLTSERK